MLNICTRVCPSPTGDPHIGTAYIALFNYAFSKKFSGNFFLRIDDTDQKRSTIRNKIDIINSIKWLHLFWHNSINFFQFEQSNRKKIYYKYIILLLEKSKAYLCICTSSRLLSLRNKNINLNLPPKYDSFCKHINHCNILKQIYLGASYVVRLNILNNNIISFNDLHSKKISISSNELDEQILFKSDKYPTYHLACVLDDHFMKITHILRGEEWISSTPKHILLYKSFNWSLPSFYHLPLLKNKNKKKISKRNNDTSILHYKKNGIYYKSLLNYLSSVSYSCTEKKNIFSLEQFIYKFSLNNIVLKGNIFNQKKIYNINKLYLKKTKISHNVYSQIYSLNYMNSIIDLIYDKLFTVQSFVDNYHYFFKTEINITLQKNTNIKFLLVSLLERLDKINIFSQSNIEKVLKESSYHITDSNNTYFESLRYILTGQLKSPPLSDVLFLLGKIKSLSRIRVFCFK